MITTKVFSVEDDSLIIIGETIKLYDDTTLIATNNKFLAENVDAPYLLPQSIIYPTDEVIAEEKYPVKMEKITYNNLIGYSDIYKNHREGFIAGRKSFGDKKYHLSEDELINIVSISRPCDEHGICLNSYDDIVASLTPPIFPHTITVEHDGDNYLWETLKVEY